MLGLVDVLYTAVFDLNRWKEGRLVGLTVAAIGTELALHDTPCSGENDSEKLHLVAKATCTMNQNFWPAAFDRVGKPWWVGFFHTHLSFPFQGHLRFICL